MSNGNQDFSSPNWQTIVVQHSVVPGALNVFSTIADISLAIANVTRTMILGFAVERSAGTVSRVAFADDADFRQTAAQNMYGFQDLNSSFPLQSQQVVIHHSASATQIDLFVWYAFTTSA